ncbi:hypothetical protein H4217_003490 [Coemansia sp. RSA 1939]|nr:hypothetical protein H4217_003490 [Coemansia sp. RSA 1939]KAJ2608277.1 hypothetical protein EV177_005067 [Coemansia sp. RSA 1804]KAJ2668676.1 hypothetical protein GGH99_006424 [Coemansia sp. RSA 1285]
MAPSDLLKRVVLEPDVRAEYLSTLLNVKVDPVTTADTIVIIIGAAVFGITALMIVFAWINIKYRPIRAKNMTWTTLMHISGILWFLGDIPSNGHVRLNGVWIICKLWVVWFRVLFCYIFASMHIVRFFALDRVFNQNKPFRGITNIIALVVVVVFNVLFCVISQVVSDEITVASLKDLELCNVTQHYRIAALVLQWVLWAGVAVLIFRLRNIQSSFNEFRESLALFIMAIIVLIETTVTNMAFLYYPLMLRHRLEKTLMDIIGANVMVWLIIGQPVYMCIFHRRRYETQWLEKLTRDGRKAAYDVSSGQGGTTAYVKMGERDASMLQNSHINFGSSDAIHTLNLGHGTNDYFDVAAMNPDGNTLTSPDAAAYSESNGIPLALRSNLQIRRPVLNTPTMFNVGYSDMNPDGRRVI